MKPAPPVTRILIRLAFLSSDGVIADIQYVHTCFQKTVDCFFRRTHNWLALVERRVQNDGDTGEFREIRDQLMITRVQITRHSLKPAGAIYVSHSWKSIA